MAHGYAGKHQVYAQTKDRVCSRKMKYPSEAAADSQIRQYHSGDSSMTSYECKFCGKWHIGHGKVTIVKE
jgi:hypothetical protein